MCSHSFDEPVDELLVVVETDETDETGLEATGLVTELEDSLGLDADALESVDTVLTAGSEALGTEVPSDDLVPPPSRKSVTYHPEPLS